MALIALAVRLGGGAARRDKDCVKARHTPCCSLSTTHFSSTANTILFVSGHYPQMLDHHRQNSLGRSRLEFKSPQTRAVFFFFFQIPVDITKKTKCIAVLTRRHQERSAFGWLPSSVCACRTALMTSPHKNTCSPFLLSELLNKICSTCYFIPNSL